MSTNIRSSNTQLILWAESESEAMEFLHLINGQVNFSISEIYVAKRSGGKRAVGSKYTEGIYFPYDQEQGATLTESVEAPPFVTDLVQWCSPDLILATRTRALLSIEITYHLLTYNNVAQRIPRQIRSATLGVPSVIFQKVEYSSSNNVLISWFLETFRKATTIYGAPCLAIVFDEEEYAEAKELFVELLNSVVHDQQRMSGVVSTVKSRMAKGAVHYDEDVFVKGKRGQERTWLRVSDDIAEVIIGVKDNCALTSIDGYGCQGTDAEKREFRKSLNTRAPGAPGCVWLSKGTGGMDPYPGLIKMVEILLCYDDEGRRVRELHASFSRLPEDFWWFQKNQREIYYKLVREFADSITYADEYR